MKKTGYIFALFFAGSLLSASAQPLPLLHYQGRLSLGTNLVNGNIDLVLRVVTGPSGGEILYEDSNTVTVVDGLYATYIGDNTTTGELTQALTATNVYLEVVVNGNTLTPRELIGASAYSIVSINTYNLGGQPASAFATGTPLYVESDPVWTAVSNDVQGQLSVNAAGIATEQASRIGADSSLSNSVTSLTSGLANKLDSNTWAAADSTTNSVRRTGDAMSGALALPSGGLSVGVSQLVVTAAGNLVSTGTVTALEFVGGGSQLSGISGGQLDAGSITGDKLAFGAVGFSNIASGAVGSDAIADGSISNADVAANTFWSAAGNGGTVAGTHFVGTTDNQPFEIRVNGIRAALITPTNGAPNIILGGAQNVISDGTFGSSILGGGSNSVSVLSRYSTIAGGEQNRIGALANHAAVGGGATNTIGSFSFAATIAGGELNFISDNSIRTAIGGGFDNRIGANASHATIAGGAGNMISNDAFHATIAGGRINRIGEDSDDATIGGGGNNIIGSNSTDTIIAGGSGNKIGSNSDDASIGGGGSNSISNQTDDATIAGGGSNAIGVDSDGATIGGGTFNRIGNGSSSATIAGGAANDIGISSFFSTVGGGFNNNISNIAMYATIPGGRANVVGFGATNAFAAGRRAVANHRGTFIWADDTDADFASTTNNQFLIRASGGVGIGTNATTPDGLAVAGSVTAAGFAGDGAGITNLGSSSLAAGSVTSDKIATNAVTGDKLAADSVTGDNVVDGTISSDDFVNNSFWTTEGNGGTVAGTHFIGTTDDQPFEIRVNNVRAVLVTPTNGAVNIILGAAQNAISNNTVGASILGGSNSTIAGSAHYSVIAGGRGNDIGAGSTGASIGGGVGNDVGVISDGATIAGGQGNIISVSSFGATVGGGLGNSISTNADNATIAGGVDNEVGVNSSDATVGGGNNNRIFDNALDATIAGGENNDIGSISIGATVGGGSNNKITDNANYSTIAGGNNNTIFSNAVTATVGGGGENDIRSGADYSTIAGGNGNRIDTDAIHSTVGGGAGNTIGINAGSATIAGGADNEIGANSGSATVGGGFLNSIGTNAGFATIPGGRRNSIGDGATDSFAAGRRAIANHRGTFVWADDTNADFSSTTNNQFLIRASGGVGIGTNATTPDGLTVVGGATFGSSVSASGFSGNGAGITNLGSSSLADGTVSNVDIAASAAITGNKLAAGTISNANFAANSVTGDKLVDGTVSNVDLAVSSVNSATVVDASLTGTDINDGTISNVDVAVNTFWSAAGNGGTVDGTHFIGSTDDQPFHIRANNLRAVLIQPSNGSPNVVFGAAGNIISNGTRGASILGGSNNIIAAKSDYAVIGGGRDHNIGTNASFATIPGGRENEIGNGATNAFAAGRRAIANHRGTFVWADDTDADFTSTSNNQFLIRASGGVGVGTNSTTPNGLTVAGSALFGGTVTAANFVGNGSLLTAISGDEIAAGSITAEQINQEQTVMRLVKRLTVPNQLSLERFGTSVSALGHDRFIVGAGSDNFNQTLSGAVYTFDAQGNLQFSIGPSPAEVHAFFGRSVTAIGTNRFVATKLFTSLVVGNITVTNLGLSTVASEPSLPLAAAGNGGFIAGSPGNDTNFVDSGAAFLYASNAVVLVTITNPSPALNDHFGFAVAGVGTDRLVIGAPQDDVGGTDAGIAYLYDLSGSLVRVVTNPAPSSSDRFGCAIAVVGVSNFLIGADGESGGRGRAYLYNLAGDLVLTVTNPVNLTGARFGSGLTSLGTDRFVVGAYSNAVSGLIAGSAFVFDLQGVLIARLDNPEPESGEEFGLKMAGSPSGRLVIGVQLDDAFGENSGTAWLYESQGVASGVTVEYATKLSGVLDTDQFSAYQDLSAEGRLDNDQDEDILTRLQSDNRYFLSGNSLGIGTTTPNAPLHVMDGTVSAPSPSSGTILTLERNGANYISMLARTNSEQGILFGDSLDSVEGAIMFNSVGVTNGLQFRTLNNLARMTITASGGVGIGIADPDHRLVVAGSGAFTAIGSASIVLENESVTGKRWQWHSLDDGRMQFIDKDAALSRLLIDTNGLVGIGESSPGAKLDVREALARVAVFNRTGDDGVLVNWQREGLNVGSVMVAAGVVTYNAFSGAHYGWSDEPLTQGQLVSMTGVNRTPSNGFSREPIYGVALTRRANDPATLGSYLSLEEPKQPAGDENNHQITAVGNGELWVTDGGGDLSAGDYLISSDIPGCAMKDDPARFPIGYICARASEPVRWSDVAPGADGIRRKRITILFETFVRDSSGEHSPAIQALVKENAALKSAVETLTTRLDVLESHSGIK